MPATHGPQILVVDDEPGVLRLLEVALPAWGFAVWPASSGEAALELYRRYRQTIDAVLLDVQLGSGMDGPQTWSALRAMNTSLKGAFMSGDTGRYTPDQLLRLGASLVLHKPFRSLAVLKEALLGMLAEAAPAHA
jgi:CheY-like chemotaxis protein